MSYKLWNNYEKCIVYLVIFNIFNLKNQSFLVSVCTHFKILKFNYFSFYGNSVFYYKFYSVALAWTFLCGSRTWVQMCRRLWLALYQSSQVTHWPLWCCQWPCSHRVHIVPIIVPADTGAGHLHCCFHYCHYNWILLLWVAARGGHQEMSSTGLLCCISCHAPINKCSMYCLETSVVRKVKSFLMWTNIKSLAQITLCMYFHCQLCIYRILVQHFWQLEIE